LIIPLENISQEKEDWKSSINVSGDGVVVEFHISLLVFFVILELNVLFSLNVTMKELSSLRTAIITSAEPAATAAKVLIDQIQFKEKELAQQYGL
jgi:hypothetical protein